MSLFPLVEHIASRKVQARSHSHLACVVLNKWCGQDSKQRSFLAVLPEILCCLRYLEIPGRCQEIPGSWEWAQTLFPSQTGSRVQRRCIRLVAQFRECCYYTTGKRWDRFLSILQLWNWSYNYGIILQSSFLLLSRYGWRHHHHHRYKFST